MYITILGLGSHLRLRLQGLRHAEIDCQDQEFDFANYSGDLKIGGGSLMHFKHCLLRHFDFTAKEIGPRAGQRIENSFIGLGPSCTVRLLLPTVHR